MTTVDFRKVKGIGRDCPHPGCGLVFEVALDALPFRDSSHEFQCEQCKSIIPWIEIERIANLLEEIRDLAHQSTAFRILA